MTDWHGYILVELPSGFTATERRVAYDALQQMGLPWSTREVHGFSPIVWVYNEETEEWEKTGGEPITWIEKYHYNQPSIMCHCRGI